MVTTQWVANPFLVEYCRELSTVRAHRLARDVTELPITVPPMFGWADLGDAVGKKSKAEGNAVLADGQDRYLMPVRLQYADDQQVLIGDGPHQVQCVAVGPGGFREELSWRSYPQHVRSAGAMVSSQGKMLVDKSTIIRAPQHMQQLSQAAHEALWTILLDLEQQLIAVMEHEHQNMRSEIYATIGKWSDRWVSSQDIEHVASLAVHNPSQSLMRALEAQINDQEVFDKVDPQRHMSSKVRQAAQRLVHDAIGDLSDGRGAKIRNAAAQLRCKDPDVLPQLMLDSGLTDVLHHRSSVVTALNPVPSAAVAMDGIDLDNIPTSRVGQSWS